MTAYSFDRRERVLADRDDGLKTGAVAPKYRSSDSRVRRLLQHDAPITGLSGIAWLGDEKIAPCPEPLQQRIAARRMRQSFPEPGRCLLVAGANALSFASAGLVPYRLAR